MSDTEINESKPSKPCSLKVIRGGRKLAGTSAQLAHISDLGGWDAFLQATAREAVDIFIDTYNRRIEDDLQQSRRPRLRVVGK